MVRGQKKPRSPSLRVAGHHVHVQVGDALADPVVHRDERAAGLQALLDGARHPLDPLEERADVGRGR